MSILFTAIGLSIIIKACIYMCYNNRSLSYETSIVDDTDDEVEQNTTTTTESDVSTESENTNIEKEDYSDMPPLISADDTVNELDKDGLRNRKE